MDDIRGDILGPPHGTISAAVIGNKNKLRSFKSSGHINEKGDGPYRGFGYLSLFSDPIDLSICEHGSHFELATRISRINLYYILPMHKYISTGWLRGY